MSEKFFFLQNIQEYLEHIGLSLPFADLITFVTACAIMAILVWILDILGARILLAIVHLAVKRTKTMWDDFLLKRKFFARLIKLIAAVIILASVKVVFQGYNTEIIRIAEVIAQIFIVTMGILIVGSFLDTANDVYESKPIAKQKSIKGIIQAIKIIVYVIGGIVIISIVIKKDPTQLLVGLGASAAIMTLVFKDTILGFVASIQISAQDMIRPGDWIEMPSKGADGVVMDINVNNVKVRNWDNTITMIPIYTLVSDSFTNWRHMEESAGRRFSRPLLIDIYSVSTLYKDQITALKNNPLIAPLAAEMEEISTSTNTSTFVTNVGLFRCYVEAYLNHHPQVAHTQPTVVKYIDLGENGIGFQLYAFSTEKDFMRYEQVVSDIINHVIIMAPIFSLNLYQKPMSTPKA